MDPGFIGVRASAAAFRASQGMVMIASLGSREGATGSRSDRRAARTAIARLALVGCALLISHESNAGGAATDLLDVRQAPAAVASIDTSTRVRQQLPDTLFGFNVQHFNFENDLWIDEKSRTDPRVIEALKFFSGSTLPLSRRPGGKSLLVAGGSRSSAGPETPKDRSRGCSEVSDVRSRGVPGLCTFG
jgi:hypothetical protein